MPTEPNLDPHDATSAPRRMALEAMMFQLDPQWRATPALTRAERTKVMLMIGLNKKRIIKRQVDEALVCDPRTVEMSSDDLGTLCGAALPALMAYGLTMLESLPLARADLAAAIEDAFAEKPTTTDGRVDFLHMGVVVTRDRQATIQRDLMGLR